MIEKKQFKKLVGKVIYGIPLQNSVRRGIPLSEQIKKFTVVKVNRIMVEMEGGVKYYQEGTCDNNFGYDFYETLELAEGYFIISNLKRRLHSSYNLDISLDQAKRIIKILDEE